MKINEEQIENSSILENDTDLFHDVKSNLKSKIKINETNTNSKKNSNKNNTSTECFDNLNNKNNTKEVNSQDDNETIEEENDLSFSEMPHVKEIIKRSKAAKDFDIVPIVAIPYSIECQSVVYTHGPKWLISGGEDGYIRKYDFIASLQGKSNLTIAQKHNLIDQFTNAGVLISYWENEEPYMEKKFLEKNKNLNLEDLKTSTLTYDPILSPVYALDSEKYGFWMLSGLKSGGISLYSMRYNEGTLIYFFNPCLKHFKNSGHTNTVSVIKLNNDQNKFLTGSWDKTIKYWDLNTGNQIANFSENSGQISTIQFRPQGLDDLTDCNYDDKTNSVIDDESENDSLFRESIDSSNDDLESVSSRNSNSKINNKTEKHNNILTKDENIFLSTTIDGKINIWDLRDSKLVLQMGVSSEILPWCMSSTWSNCGEYIYAGRRNSLIEEISIKMPTKNTMNKNIGQRNVPFTSNLFLLPKMSGPVYSIATMPNNNFLICGSNDNIRLCNLKSYSSDSKKKKKPFLIILGQHGGIISSLIVDKTGRFLTSSSGNRGWGNVNFSEFIFIYEINF